MYSVFTFSLLYWNYYLSFRHEEDEICHLQKFQYLFVSSYLSLKLVKILTFNDDVK